MDVSPAPRSSPVAFSCVVLVAWACGAVPDDAGERIFPPQGVIRGTVVYEGPRPCSRQGHIVGDALVLVFYRRNPPPPDGLATTAVNFADVTGDVLFGDEPRYTGPDAYCPPRAGFTERITASAPFEVAPLAGGSYEIRAFFDYTGDFLPEFKIRNLPERGDIGGGDIDTGDALKAVNEGNLNFRPIYLPVNVGVPQPLSPAVIPPAVPDYLIPSGGFVADNVTVTIGAPLGTTRPYFYAEGEQVSFDLGNPTNIESSVAQSSDQRATDSNGIEAAAETDPDSMPVLTIPQDIGVLAPPANVSSASLYLFESKFPHLRLAWGVPNGEIGKATAAPFQMQIVPFGQGGEGAGFLVWQNATLDAMSQQYVPQLIPEGNGVPELWPEVVLTNLVDPSANSTVPMIVLQGITLLGGVASDSLVGTAGALHSGALFGTGSGGGPKPVVFAQDHLVVVLRPSVICFPSPFERGTLVTPHPTATTADIDCSSTPCAANGTPDQPVAPPGLLMRLASVVSSTATACLPMGRYAINVVYPDGQAWTVPNEAGACSGTEGSTDYAHLTCTLKQRPVLYSQGNRAVVEIVAARDPAYCQANPVPNACLGSR